MNELEEIMNGKHEIKHLKIDNDTLSFNTELDNYDWNLTPRDIEMIIYTLQEDKNNLQSKINEAIEYINKEYDTEPHELYGLVSADELLSILNDDKIQGIPQFKGTMEQLDNLCDIRKEGK